MTGGNVIGAAARLDAVEHYRTQAILAQLPAAVWELRAARTDLIDSGTGGYALDRIEKALVMLTGQPLLGLLEDRDLVWERLPDGTYAWLKADLTLRDRRP